MIYLIGSIIILILILIITIFYYRNKSASLQKRLSVSIQACIKLQEDISQKNENINNLQTQVIRNEEINREYTRRLNEISNMTLHDHVDNINAH